MSEHSGLHAYIISKDGLKSKTIVYSEENHEIHQDIFYWRNNPKLGCAVSYLNSITAGINSDGNQVIKLLIDDFDLLLETDERNGKKLYNYLVQAHRIGKSKNVYFQNFCK